MKFIRPLVFASAFAFLGSAAWSDDAHHPKAASTAATAPKSAPGNVLAKESVKKMDKQITDMRQMHEKMMNAKTTEERSALAGEHMKSMQDGMAMMGANAGTGGMKAGISSDMAMHHQSMEKRMEMMEVTMQMMMDRLPPAAAK